MTQRTTIQPNTYCHARAMRKGDSTMTDEDLASDQAQDCFSSGNDAYPAVPGIGLAPSVSELGIFWTDAMELSEIAKNLEAAQRILNEAGWR